MSEQYEVQQHTGLRWETFSWEKGDGASVRSQATFHGSARCWPDRPHRVVRVAGDSRQIVIFHDARGDASYQR